MLYTDLNFQDALQSMTLIGTWRWYCTPKQKLACFVLYLKIINTFWKIIYASYSELYKILKNDINI